MPDLVSVDPTFVRLCALAELPESEAIAVELELALDGGTAMESVIVWRQDGAVRAWLNVCPHAGRRLDWAPGRFLVKDGVLICAAHGASFDTRDGLCIGGPCRGESLRGLRVSVVDGEVCVAA